METFWQDIRYSARAFLKKPAFTFIAVITLALGIGANTAVFSVVNSVLLRPLGFQEPERLVAVWETFAQPGVEANLRNEVSLANFLDWRAEQSVFDGLAALYYSSVNLTGDGEPERIQGAVVTTNLFQVLGTQPLKGRAFFQEEENPASPRSVVLSYGLWQRRFASDETLLGKTLTLNDTPVTVAGVMPPGFELQFPTSRQVDMWLPMRINTSSANRRGHYLYVIGRLKQGVAQKQAHAEMNMIAGQLEQHYPETNTNKGANVVGLHAQMVGSVEPYLYVLLAAVGFVLLIACANVANLLLARAASRRKEIAIRTALGAARSRIIRQMLTESLLLSLMGGAAGLLIAVWAVDAILAFSPKNLPQIAEAGLDLRVLSFMLVLSIVTGMIFGLIPALQSSRPNLNETLKEGGRNATSPNHLTRNLLVISEIALTLVLLVGAGLMIKSLLQLQKVDPGLDPRNVVTMQIDLPLSKYAEGRQWSAFFEQVIERVETLPGVESAAVTWQLPLSGAGGSAGFEIEGRVAEANQRNLAANHRVSAGYFKTLRIPVMRGRQFTDEDRRSAARPVIINEAMSRRYFANEDPLGKRIKLLGATREIVGVVKEANYSALDQEAAPAIYNLSSLWTMNLVVRTYSDPLAVVSAIKKEVQAIDSQQPVSNVQTMEQLLAASFAPRRFQMLLLGIFAALALLLASVGIYGVLSHSVAERTREIGIRMALGAQAGDVLKLVIGQGMTMTLAGIAIGLAAAFALTRLMESLLFKVSVTDFATFAAISLTLTGVALGACFIPARRATKVDPMVALRYE